MVSQCTKFEVSGFTRYEAIHGGAKCRKFGGLGRLGGTQGHAFFQKPLRGRICTKCGSAVSVVDVIFGDRLIDIWSRHTQRNAGFNECLVVWILWG